MIDDKKIETAKEEIYEDKFLGCGEMVEAFEDEDEMEMFDKEDIKEAIGLGAEWAINELLKDLLHPASEVPRNDNGKILAFSKVNSNMNAMLYETACYTYQGKQEVRVREYTFIDLLFVEDLLDLIKKGGNHD